MSRVWVALVSFLILFPYLSAQTIPPNSPTVFEQTVLAQMKSLSDRLDGIPDRNQLNDALTGYTNRAKDMNDQTMLIILIGVIGIVLLGYFLMFRKVFSLVKEREIAELSREPLRPAPIEPLIQVQKTGSYEPQEPEPKERQTTLSFIDPPKSLRKPLRPI